MLQLAPETGWAPSERADGQRFLVRATPQPAAQPLTVIVNRPALLKKGAHNEDGRAAAMVVIAC